jgi:hypothetical protein
MVAVLSAVHPDIEQFDHNGKGHRKVDVTFRHMHIKPFSNHGEPDQIVL